MDFVREPPLVEDSELVHGFRPIPAVTPPICGDVPQCHPNQL